MTENSRAGLTLLAPDREVVGTREEFHQPDLRAYAPLADGRPRNVVVELALAPIEADHHRGRRGVEIRLDGQRIGELSSLMSARYGPLVEDVLFLGGRPACITKVVNGGRGVEVELLLPTVAVDAVVPPEVLLPAAPMARTRQRTPYLVGAGVAALLIVVGLSVGRGGVSTVPAAGGAPVVVATTTAAPTPTSTAPVTTVRSTPAPPPTRPSPAAAPTPPEAPEPAPEAAPEPSDECEPNYGDCVPVAEDVDCDEEGGDGPVYVAGPVEITGTDIYDLDPDDDGTGCD